MKKYDIVYADPPWRYNNNGVQGAAEHHYPTMSMDELKAMDVNGITADNSALFMWTSCPFLADAIDLTEAWGFEYVTVAFCWVKSTKDGSGYITGTGFWTRSNVELCLFARKGHLKRVDNTVKQLIVEPRREHSRKPDCTRERIDALLGGGNLNKLEMFARQATDGWELFGNELPNDIEL